MMRVMNQIVDYVRVKVEICTFDGIMKCVKCFYTLTQAAIESKQAYAI